MTVLSTDQVLRTFVDFYRERGHRQLIGSSLITPPDDRVLFTTSGMHPLTPYFEGPIHPFGPRLVNVQRCLRTTDLDEVGDSTHLTVFEMLGSWSLGDYDHQQSIRWGFELLRDGFGIPSQRMYVTVFGGGEQVGPDTESERTWSGLGVSVELLGEHDNWWSNGPTGPCGPDSEIFVWTGDGPPEGRPSTDTRWVEVWNHVSMRYHRGEDGVPRPLVRSNVDTGMGLERMLTVLQNKQSVYETDLFTPWTTVVGGLWGLDEVESRLVCDHLRSSVVVVGDGVTPSNTGRGYVLRRLIRRLLTVLWRGDPTRTLSDLPPEPIRSTLDHFGQKPKGVLDVLVDEQRRFDSLLRRGRVVVERYRSRDELTEDDYHYLHDTHGLPRDLVDGLLTVGDGSSVVASGGELVR